MEEELEGFLRERGVDDDVIREMKDEKINISAIQCMSDEILGKYLRHAGDIYSVKHFCKKGAFKETFAMKLKQKLVGIGEYQSNKVKTHAGSSSSDSIHHKKLTRKITIGWICNGRQIRANNGGGVRDVDVPKTYKKGDIIKLALNFFFPNGESTKGFLKDYNYDLYDFKNNTFDDSLTVERIYDITRLTRIRFFLVTTSIIPNNNDDNTQRSKPRKNKRKRLKVRTCNASSSDSTDDHGSDFDIKEYLSFTHSGSKKKVRNLPTSTVTREPDVENQKLGTNTSTQHNENSSILPISSTYEIPKEIPDTHFWEDGEQDILVTPTNFPTNPSATESYSRFYSNYIEENLFNSNDWNHTNEVGLTTLDDTKNSVICEELTNFKSELILLQSKIDYEKTVIINACRQNIVSCIARAIRRTSFSPFKKLDVIFVDIAEISEGAIDGGGPSRELWRLALRELQMSNIFSGKEDSKNIYYNLSFLETKKYLEAGQIMSLSLIHGGPGPSFLSETLYNCLAFDIKTASPSIDDIDNQSIRNELLAVSEAKCVEDLQSAIGESSILLELGVSPIATSNTQKDKIVQGALQQLIIDRPRQAIEQFVEGLNMGDIISLIKKYPEECKPLFCPTKDNNVTVKLIRDLFVIKYGVAGTHQRTVENTIVSYWWDYLQNCEDGDCEVVLEKILSFATGADKIPPLGFPKEPSIEFLNGDICRFPKSNTCALILYLPVAELNYDKFVENMDFGILNGLPIFGMA